MLRHHYFGSLVERLRLVRKVRRQGSAIVWPIRLPHPAGRRPSTQIAVGRGTTIGPWVWFSLPSRSARVQIGNGCYFGANVSIACAKSVVIGDGVGIAERSTIVDHTHDPESWFLRADDEGKDPQLGWGITEPDPVVLEPGCLLGVGVFVAPGVTIGRGAVIGANSVVTTDIPEFTIAAGVPAKVLRSLR